MQKVTFKTDDVIIYIAPAGGGKTYELMREMPPLLSVYRPDEIAFVTFTRKGVANGIERALLANPMLTPDDLVYFKTLHALCFRELGLKHTAILERKDIKIFNELLGFDLHFAEAFENQSDDDKLLTRYDAVRSGGNQGIVTEGAYDEERYIRLIAAYETFKKENALVDFFDCLTMFRDRNQPIVSVKVAFIDEAQDLTSLQWEVCQIAFAKAEKIRVAGDDFQSLFKYAGANPAILVDLAKRYKTVKLEKSYRLPRAVYHFAKGITNMIEDKIDKDFVPVKDVEGFVREYADSSILARKIRDDFDESGYIPYRWYLLFRNNCFIDAMADILEQYIIPFHTAKGFCISGRDIMKIRRYMNYRKSGFGSDEAKEAFCKENSVKDINDDFCESTLIPGEKRFAYSDYVRKYGIDTLEDMSKKEPYLFLSTTHRVKGGEADYVAVFLDCTKRVMDNILLNLDEELRVLYVACTRSKLGLYLMQSTGKYGLDSVIEMVKEHSDAEVVS